MTRLYYERIPLRRRQQGGAVDQQQQAPVDDPEAQRQAELEQLVAENAPPQRQVQPSPLSALARFEALAPLYRSSSMLGAPILNPAASALASGVAGALPHQQGGRVEEDDGNPENLTPEEQAEIIREWEAKARAEQGEGDEDAADEFARGGYVGDDDGDGADVTYVRIPHTGYPQAEPTRLEYERVVSPRDRKLHAIMSEMGAHRFLHPRHAAIVFRDLLR